MKDRIYHTAVIVSLLTNYILVGALGILETFSVICQGTTNYQITQQKTGQNSNSKVYFTQHKHIPSNIKVDVPAPAVIDDTEIYKIEFSDIPYICEYVIIYLDPSVFKISSRAPPQA